MAGRNCKGKNNPNYGKKHPGLNKGRKCTIKQKLKISNTLKQKYKSGYINPNKGRIFTEEWKRKLRENHSDVSGKNNPMFGRKRKSQFGELNNNWKNGSGAYRRIAYKKYGYICNKCGITNKKVLLVHHKDRNRKNNNIDNLEILCRNCHTLEHYEEVYKKFMEHIKRKNIKKNK